MSIDVCLSFNVAVLFYSMHIRLLKPSYIGDFCGNRRGDKNCSVGLDLLFLNYEGDGEEIERAREAEKAREKEMVSKTEILREMYMEMVETVIAEGRWKYRVDVPCVYSRRRPNSVRLYFSDYVLRIFFLFVALMLRAQRASVLH